MDKTFGQYEKNFLGSGWAFPVTFSSGTFLVNTTSYEQNVNTSIETILNTRRGERCMEPGFGSGLQKFFFRKMDATLKGEIAEAVKFSLLHNEPRITVKEVTVNYADIPNGLVEVTVVYVYNQTNTRHNFVFPFHVKEGTNLG